MGVEYPRTSPPTTHNPTPTSYQYNHSTPKAPGGADQINAYYDAKLQQSGVPVIHTGMTEEAWKSHKKAKEALVKDATGQAKLEKKAYEEARKEAYAYEQEQKAQQKAWNESQKAQKKAAREAQAVKEKAAKGVKEKAPPGGLELYIPAWSDVIKLGPDTKATQAQTREYYNARKEGRAPNLPSDVVSGIENKARRLRAMRESQVPELYQKIGSFLTTMDNINDAMITAAWVARVGALIAPPAAPFLLPLSAGLTLGASALNIFTWLAPLALPMYGAKKLSSVLTKKIGTKGLTKALKIPGPLAKYLPSFQEFVQIAQTTADWTGYGLSIGPIYGAVQESFFRKVVNPVDRLIGNPVSGLSSWTMRGIRAVTETFGLGSVFDPLDHLYDLVVLHACLSSLCTPEVSAAMPHLIGESMGSWAFPNEVEDDANREMLIQEGIDPDLEPAFMYPGSPELLYCDDSITAFAPLLAHNLTDWIPHLPDPFLMCFAGLLLNECADMFMLLLGGYGAQIETTLDPQSQAIQQIVHYGLIPPQETPTHEAEGYLNSVTTKLIAADRTLTPWDVLDIYLDYGFEYPPPHRR